MPIPSPFHERTRPLCESYSWTDWAGCYAVRRYGFNHIREYQALRQAAGLIDISPLYKYEVKGPDSGAVLSRMMVRDISRLPVGRVAYSCWCDDRGKVIDDGTVSRLAADHYRLTAADPSGHWLRTVGEDYGVSIVDSSRQLAALALQGPNSRKILRQCSDLDLDRFRFFGVKPALVAGLDVWVSRTGYTGDLGYEIWVDRGRALTLWDALMTAGAAYGIAPTGLDALDMARIEAGFVMLGVDYFSASKMVLESRKSTPYEIGLGWTVELEREPFVGQAALRREHSQGSASRLIGLETSWKDLEKLYDSYGLSAQLPPAVSRSALPIYEKGRQVGHASSHTWSPLLKKRIALGSVDSRCADPRRRLEIEHTVEFQRRRVAAMVSPLPFFNPERKRKP